ncbi:hypothetical protein ACOSQ3_012674 [Xanthoceras sorbifolium]
MPVKLSNESNKEGERRSFLIQVKLCNKRALAIEGSGSAPLSWQRIRRLERELDADLHTEEASIRRFRNSIRELYDPNEAWCERPSDLSRIVLDYFDSIFTTSNPSIDDLDGVLSFVES